MRHSNIAFNPENLKGARVLITGGSGFLGTHLIKKLQQLDAGEIISVHRSGDTSYKELHNIVRITCDMSLPESVEVIRAIGHVDYVCNLAGLTDQRMPHPAPKELWDANVITLIHLTHALDWKKVKAGIHIGTTSEYGNQKVPFCEDNALYPTNMYGWSKAASTQYAHMMTHAGLSKWRIARLFTGYGPGHHAGFIVNLTRALMRGEKFVVNPQHATRDFIFVDDIIEGLLRMLCCTEAEGEIINLCTGKETSLEDAAKIIHALVGTGSIELSNHNFRQGDFMHSVGSTEKLERLIGWKPSTTLEDGLPITIVRLT